MRQANSTQRPRPSNTEPHDWNALHLYTKHAHFFLEKPTLSSPNNKGGFRHVQAEQLPYKKGAAKARNVKQQRDIFQPVRLPYVTVFKKNVIRCSTTFHITKSVALGV